jgi:AcrR family transcriptional regulator
MTLPMPRTPNAGAGRREQIMDAALRVFASKGYTRTTIKDIAGEAGITTGLIYHYFTNKDALLKTIFEERSPLQMFHSIPQSMLELPPEALLRFIAAQLLAIVEDERFMQLMRVYLPEAIFHAEAAPFGIFAIQQGVQFLENYLKARMETGELCCSDPGLAAHLFLGSLMDIVLRRQILHDPDTLRYTQAQIVDSLVSTTLSGLLPR